MNYRHAFHAGNFADVLKHVVLMMLVEHLKKKPAPFFYLDTHAGGGTYDLSLGESQRTDKCRVFDERSKIFTARRTVPCRREQVGFPDTETAVKIQTRFVRGVFSKKRSAATERKHPRCLARFGLRGKR